MNEREKHGATLGLVALMVIVVCLSVFSIWRIEGLQSKVASLETQNSQLCSNITSLQEDIHRLENTVQNLSGTTLNMTFIETEELIIENFLWQPSLESTNITVRNTGTTTLTILFVMANGEGCSMEPPTTTLSPGEAGTIEVARYYESFVSGTTYEFALITAKGNTFTYTSVAP